MSLHFAARLIFRAENAGRGSRRVQNPPLRTQAILVVELRTLSRCASFSVASTNPLTPGQAPSPRAGGPNQPRKDSIEWGRVGADCVDAFCLCV